MRTLIAATLPVRDASISGVSPFGWRSFTSAPAFRSFSSIAALPLVAARDIDVAPS
jgi:hypothetical protein